MKAEESTDRGSDHHRARAILEQLAHRYQTARRYADQAVIRFRYRQGDTSQEEQVPLAVQYAGPDRLAVHAYQTVVDQRAGTLRAFIDSPAVNRLDRQQLQLEFRHAKVTLDTLLRDPVLAHFLTAGPAGLPPQLQLLFGDDPLADWIPDDVPLTFAAPATLAGQRCHRLQLDTSDGTTLLWIDAERPLLRRIDLPRLQLPAAALPPAVLASLQPARGEGISEDVTLSIQIDFTDAQLEGRAASFDASPFAPAPLPSGVDVTVDSLTLPPPPLISAAIGRVPQPFTLKCRHRSRGASPFQVTAEGSDRPFTVLLWVAAHVGSQAAAQQLAAYRQQLSPELRQATRFVVVEAEPGASAGLAKAEWAASVGPDALAWASDREAIGRDRFGIEEAPAIVVLDEAGMVHWCQSPVGPEMPRTLDGLLGDLQAGIAVGTRLRQQYEQDLATYRQLLADRTRATGSP